ncbi:alcohol dehydrogenase catalytic domain-containing protein [Gemmobacter lanyuensis]
MQAVVCHGPGDYRLETRPVPRPGPGEVLVQVIAAGICAGDVKCFQGTPMFWGDVNRKAYAETDVIPGHEFVGRVVALGEGAGDLHGLAVGDVAVSEQIVPCGECRFCREGNYWMCQPHDLYGFHRVTQGLGPNTWSTPPNHATTVCRKGWTPAMASLSNLWAVPSMR